MNSQHVALVCVCVSRVENAKGHMHLYLYIEIWSMHYAESKTNRNNCCSHMLTLLFRPAFWIDHVQESIRFEYQKDYRSNSSAEISISISKNFHSVCKLINSNARMENRYESFNNRSMCHVSCSLNAVLIHWNLQRQRPTKAYREQLYSLLSLSFFLVLSIL